VATPLPDHLRRDEAWGAAECPARGVSIGPQPLGETKVRDLDVHVGVQEEVRGLDVSVQHALLVDVREPIKDLPAVVLSLALANPPPLLEHILQRLIPPQKRVREHVRKKCAPPLGRGKNRDEGWRTLLGQYSSKM
jgi:hypothetical protein